MFKDALNLNLEKDRPQITFPSSFQIGISTNDPGLNVTEVLYYDKNAKKIRTQVFYSILGLKPTKGIDVVIDERAGILAVQNDNECRKTNFTHSLLPVNVFFSMFNSLTHYEGLDAQG